MSANFEDELKKQTRSDWRELGFFYDYDEKNRIWLVHAARSGLQQLCAELRRYAADLNHAPISEHEHFGPYSYLKFVTWPDPKILPDGIYGSLQDFTRLADIIERKISQAATGAQIRIDADYSQRNESTILIIIAPDEFDPAEADKSICP